MSQRRRELAEKRATLLAQAQLEREHFAYVAREVEQHLAGIDRTIQTVRTMAAKPVVIAGAIALLAYIGPRRLLRVAARGAGLIASGRQVMKLLR